MQINVPTLVASVFASALTTGVMLAGFVKLQTASPGTPDTGHVHVTGNVLAGRLGSGVSPSLARVQVKESGTLQGVRSESVSGVAVFGKSTAADGLGAGGYFTTSSSVGRGIVGDALSGTGNTVGGLFYNRSLGGGVGVWGRATGTAGSATGVFGETVSGNGTALAARNSLSGQTVSMGTGTDTVRTEGALPRHHYSTAPRPMVPLAYGLVSAGGTAFLSGSGNWTVTKPATGRYTITVIGLNILDEVVSVTPSSSSSARSVTLNQVGSAGTIGVNTWSSTGTAIDTAFHFVIFRQSGNGLAPTSPLADGLDESRPLKTPGERDRMTRYLAAQAAADSEAPYEPPVDVESRP